ncbi:hypothetical protein [Pseudomonas sp.]|uniref:hypothetical protein n=1 Tax=Pseudomonas sp. TaxID=306 RepID=UPI00257DEA89|nr:hypothetical protein [Pseudomonas sp.]
MTTTNAMKREMLTQLSEVSQRHKLELERAFSVLSILMRQLSETLDDCYGAGASRPTSVDKLPEHAEALRDISCAMRNMVDLEVQVNHMDLCIQKAINKLEVAA